MTHSSLSSAQRRWYSYLIYWIIPLSGLSIDVYVPSLPHIMTSLHTTQSASQLTVALYSLGLALAQPFAGPLSDSYGRKPLMIISCLLQMVIIGLIILSRNITAIIILRVLQGVAVALLSVCARAVISDLFSGEEFRKKINLITVFWALGPILAPAIGGYLQHYFNWQATFYFMLAYVLSIIVGLFFIQETHTNKHKLNVTTVVSNFRFILKDTSFIYATCLAGIAAGFIILFNIVAPFLIQVQLKHNAIYYGHMALMMGCAWFLGNMINRMLIAKSTHSKAVTSLSANLVTCLFMLAASYMIALSPVGIGLPSFIIILFAGLLFPNLLACALAPFASIAGSANALMFSGMWLIIYAVTGLSSKLHIHSMPRLALAYFVLSICCILFYWLYSKSAKSQD